MRPCRCASMLVVQLGVEGFVMIALSVGKLVVG